MPYTQGATDCTPNEVGYDESRIPILNNHLQKLIDENVIFGTTYCASRRGKVFLHGALGYKTYRKDDSLPLSPGDIRYIASMTKTFTGVAIMKLVEDGIVCLDETVGSILPQFSTPPFDKINLFHLLTHTSGMHPDGNCFENKHNLSQWELMHRAYKLHKRSDGELDWIAAGLSNGVRDVPGKQWMYCSFGFVILGVVIEKLTGIHPHKFIEDSICKPLGMADTAFDLTPEMAKRYMIDSGEWGEKHINAILSGEEAPDEDEDFWKRIPQTGGGLNSTVADVIRYGNMMLNGGTLGGVRVLGRKAVEKMTTMAIHNTPDFCWGANTPARGYGIGFDMRNGVQFTFSDGTFMHEGAGACAMYVDPKEELVVTWIVPYMEGVDWSPRAMYNTLNIICSGLK